MRDMLIKECDMLEVQTTRLRLIESKKEEHQELFAARQRIRELEAENAALRVMAGKWLALQMKD